MSPLPDDPMNQSQSYDPTSRLELERHRPTLGTPVCRGPQVVAAARALSAEQAVNLALSPALAHDPHDGQHAPQRRDERPPRAQPAALVAPRRVVRLPAPLE